MQPGFNPFVQSQPFSGTMWEFVSRLRQQAHQHAAQSQADAAHTYYAQKAANDVRIIDMVQGLDGVWRVA